MDEGFFISGILVGSSSRERVFDGVAKVSYYYTLILNGSDTYKITSDQDYTKFIKFGDRVAFEVRPRVYNGNLYLNGDLLVDDQ